jgi:large subunit ribosomal protein L54
MKGINYFKGREDPVALKEEEYPEWLWRILDVKKESRNVEDEAGDEFCKSFFLSQSFPFL